MIQNNTNSSTETSNKVIYPDLSYKIVGMLMSTHNELGPYAKEKHYGDKLEQILSNQFNIKYKRELRVEEPCNVMDFIVWNATEGPLLLEFKAKRILTREDYFQVQRYLQEAGIKLGLLINFRNKYLKLVRIVKIDKYNRSFSFA